MTSNNSSAARLPFGSFLRVDDGERFIVIARQAEADETNIGKLHTPAAECGAHARVDEARTIVAGSDKDEIRGELFRPLQGLRESAAARQAANRPGGWSARSGRSVRQSSAMRDRLGRQWSVGNLDVESPRFFRRIEGAIGDMKGIALFEEQRRIVKRRLSAETILEQGGGTDGAFNPGERCSNRRRR